MIAQAIIKLSMVFTWAQVDTKTTKLQQQKNEGKMSL